MARSNISSARLDNTLFMEKNRFGVSSSIITGAFTIDDDMPPIVALSAAAPQNITLPAVRAGLWFFVASSGASTLTVKNVGGTTIGLVPAGTISYFVSDGVTWMSWTAGILTATDLTLTGNLVVGGNTDIGNAVSDTVGFYGATKVAQGASASQGAVSVTLVTAVVITAATSAGTTAATTTTPAGFTTKTQADKIRALVNQCKVDLAIVKARVDQARVDITAVNVLVTAMRKALVPTTGVGLIKGGA